MQLILRSVVIRRDETVRVVWDASSMKTGTGAHNSTTRRVFSSAKSKHNTKRFLCFLFSLFFLFFNFLLVDRASRENRKALFTRLNEKREKKK